MKEIVIMAGAINPEKRFLSLLKTLFPECAIRIVYAGIDRSDQTLSTPVKAKK